MRDQGITLINPNSMRGSSLVNSTAVGVVALYPSGIATFTNDPFQHLQAHPALKSRVFAEPELSVTLSFE